MSACGLVQMSNNGPLDWVIDWSVWLGGSDTITASTWEVICDDEVTPTLTVSASSFTGTNATVWLQGGTRELIYTVINTVETNDGRTQSRSFKLLSKASILIECE